MVGPSGLELLTFPASRDALTNAPTLDKILDGTMRFPALNLAFPAARIRKSCESLLVNHLPGSSSSGEEAVGAMVLR